MDIAVDHLGKFLPVGEAAIIALPLQNIPPPPWGRCRCSRPHETYSASSQLAEVCDEKLYWYTGTLCHYGIGGEHPDWP